jgi:hypothetical protein
MTDADSGSGMPDAMENSLPNTPILSCGMGIGLDCETIKRIESAVLAQT